MAAHGRLTGRATVQVGTTQEVLIYHDVGALEPSQWGLVVRDPNGGSTVQWTQGHNNVSFDVPATAVPTVAGENYYGIPGQPPGPFGSAISVRITAGTTTTFDLIMVRLNTPRNG